MALVVLLRLGTVLTPVAAQPASNPRATPVQTPSLAPPALASFARAWDVVSSYSATVTLFEQQGTAVQNVVFDYAFQKPSSFTVRVVKGPNAGVTLTWDGGTTVQATRGGRFFAALFKRTLPLHDPLVTTIRGSSIDELSYGAILAHAEQTAGRLSESRGEPIDGNATESLSLVPEDPAADAGFSRETIDISTATQLPVRIQAYEGTTLVRTIDFSDVSLKS